ncbi:hypothetical protein EJ07DRAFT_185208 [Lizonia empirigonia]|nr:hypothetical protein EJ07DRAFT_185208 [Lizonia empirigonia]
MATTHSQVAASMSRPSQPRTALSHGDARDGYAHDAAPLSLFEAIVTAYPPVLESLLAQLPTAAVLELYHTSAHLRAFLRAYPLAWRTLSFRLPQPQQQVGSPGNETPDARDRQSRAYSFDALLKQIVAPNGTRLQSLDLCNTAVTGIALVGCVLAPRIATLQHLSVRGCKNVSIKYHMVPFLEPYTLKDAPWARTNLALTSLYTYRCRHHRRRPYLPSSLVRRDSDSDPTHQLIDICHQLGIWTDTAWCPSPGGRCYRRKDYHAGRQAPQNMEVWVPFDRLWRSSNRIGPVPGTQRLGGHDGRLWEIADDGQDGEPLGTENAHAAGEGKHVPAHARKSHTTFVDNVTCAQCSDVILERCESCSVRMHCMGCRKTLCASCAFNRPIPRKRPRTRHFANLAFGNNMALGGATAVEDRKQDEKAERNRFWWAPGATRSPNLMSESAHDDDSSDDEDTLNNGLPGPPAHRDPPKLNMHWCCLEPIFSGGEASPCWARASQYEDPDFSNQLRPVDYIRELKNNGLYEYVLGEDVDILRYLKQDSLELQQQTCPRGLCNDCYRSFRWKVSCRACKNPICKEHDFGALKVRKCGYRDLHTERDHVRAHTEPPQRLLIPDFNPNRTSEDMERTPTASSQLDAASSTADNESESSEGTPMSQSQVLVAPAAPMEMAASSSFSLAATPDPFTLTSSLSFVPVSSSRPRSFSASGVRSRNLCRLEAELKAKKDAELRAKAKIERDRLERGQADELAGAMNEFFAALYTGNADTPIPDSSMYTTSFADLPLASPDSITVTTEFGVLEETGNVTIISAGGATHPYDHQNDADDDEYEADVQYQDMQSESGPETYVVMTEDTSAVPQDWVAAVALQHHQQQNSWLLQQQMQNLYNVALGAYSPVYGPPPVVPVVSQGPQMGQAPMSGDETDGGDEETDGGDEETDGGDEETDGGDEQTDGGDEETDGGDEETDVGDEDETDAGDEDETDAGDEDETDAGENETDAGEDETDAGEDETDAGDEADIDTDEVHEPPDHAEGATTPTAPHHALDPLGL